MAEARYLISDAAKKVDVESHVLRYWEEELELNIPRNARGKNGTKVAEWLELRS